MKALIANHANAYGERWRNKAALSLHDYLMDNVGKWVEIDTTHVFDDQYNTVDGFRIYDVNIQRIEGDVRTDNVFFVENQNGIDPIKEINISNRDHKKNGFLLPVWFSFTRILQNIQAF